MLVLFSVLSFVAPRTRRVLLELREETLGAIPSLTDGFNFTLFAAWHSACHSLERREFRIVMWLNVIRWSTVMGTVVIAVLISLYLFGFTLSEVPDLVTRVIVGLVVIATVVAIIEPCFLLFSRHRSPPSDSSE